MNGRLRRRLSRTFAPNRVRAWHRIRARCRCAGTYFRLHVGAVGTAVADKFPNVVAESSVLEFGVGGAFLGVIAVRASRLTLRPLIDTDALALRHDHAHLRGAADAHI